LHVELSPQDCLLRNILVKWYDGKKCVSCGKEFGKINLFDHKPAFHSPEGGSVGWNELEAEKVPEVLETYFPICWDCWIIETFCREHPDLVVDRSMVSPRVAREIAQ